MKHPGPVQMMRIAPGDLPTLPERVGRMVYDRDLMRWVKEKDADVYGGAKAERNVVESQSPTGPVGEGESEDPFRDIESLRDEESARRGLSRAADESHAPAERDFEEGNPADEGSADMDIVDEEENNASGRGESDSEFEDATEPVWSTFSLDGPSTGVVHVMTGEEEARMSSAELDDETTDSDDDDVEVEVETGASGRYSDAEDVDLSLDMASMSLREPPALPTDAVSSAGAVIAVASPARGKGVHVVAFGVHATVATTPRPAERRAVAPRSALKSASVTPVARRVPGSGHRRSVSFSDGKKDGKIVGLQKQDEADAHSAAGNVTNGFLPSARSKRIHALLDGLEDSGASNVFSRVF